MQLLLVLLYLSCGQWPCTHILGVLCREHEEHHHQCNLSILCWIGICQLLNNHYRRLIQYEKQAHMKILGAMIAISEDDVFVVE